jgi:8-oxo-dGTP pyrophosphatase MutT (NUDIX family)
VLIPVLGREVVLTKRASHLKHHPGQIALPGGKVDDGDAGAAGAALREAREEIGLDPGERGPLAELPTHETVTGYTITPVLARVRAEFQAIPEDGEVAEVFRVPLEFLMRPRTTGWKAAPGGGSGGTTTWRPMVPITSGARRRAS